MLFGLIAIVLIFVSIIVWVNIMMVSRARRDKSTIVNETAGINQEVSSDNVEAETSHLNEALQHEAEVGTADQDEVASGRLDEIPNLTVSHEVEVMDTPHRRGRHNNLFAQSSIPYVLHETTAPDFASDEWHKYFLKLTEEKHVMGWIAFEEDRVGASDREYDSEFVEVLRTYRRSVMKLKREVGLSNVLETSVIGEEGNIWFITGGQEIWFALFVDRDADVHQIAKPVMAQLTPEG